LTGARVLQRDFGWEDFEAAWDGLPVVAGVMVQVRDEADGLEEAAEMTRIAASEPRLAAMVAGNVVEDQARRGELDRLAALPLVRGIRRGTQFHPDPMYLARPEIVAGYRRAGELGLAAEICVKWFQLEAAVAFAEALPDLTVVLDHLGKPDMTRVEQPEWRRWMERLARLPNVVVKASVVVQQPQDPPLDRDAAAAIVAETVALFGWDRVLFASNWPVSTIVVGYRDWVDTLADALGGASDEQLDRVFALNAARVWRLAEQLPR
jgi:L-fuconolactonase